MLCFYLFYFYKKIESIWIFLSINTKHIVPIIEKYLPNAKIILYGSRARNDNQEGADIDIALDAGDKIDRVLMGSLLGT